MATSGEVVCGTLHRAMEGRDLGALMGLFSDDAELRVVDKGHPPSNPLECKGKGAIEQYYRDLFGREMTHTILQEVASEGSLAYTEDCEYPDGTHVLTNSMLELENGKIVRGVDVQAWDEAPKH